MDSFDRFEDLPKPALQELLLKLNYQELHTTCSNSRKAFSICKEKNFQNMYKKLHGRMIVGNLHTKLYDTSEEVSKGNVILFLKDDTGNNIRIKYGKNDKILKTFSYDNKFSPNGITISGNSIYWEPWKTANRSKDELLLKLREIGKEKLIDGFTPIVDDYFGGFFTLNSETANEIWNTVKQKVSKIYPDIENVRLSEKLFRNQ